MERLLQPDQGMELCYECEGERSCIMCQSNREIDGSRCEFCGGSGKCIVCNGAGQIPGGTHSKLVKQGLIRE